MDKEGDNSKREVYSMGKKENSRADLSRSRIDHSRSRLDKTFENEKLPQSSRRSTKKKTNKLSELYGPAEELHNRSIAISRKQSLSVRNSGGNGRKRSGEGMTGGTFNFDTHKLTIGDLKDLKWNDSKPAPIPKVIQKKNIQLDRSHMNMTLHGDSTLKSKEIELVNTKLEGAVRNPEFQENENSTQKREDPAVSGLANRVLIPNSKPLTSRKLEKPQPTPSKTSTTWLSFVKTMEKMYSSVIFTVCFASMIFLSMFLRDLWIIFFSAPTDKYCDICLGVLFVFFLLESVQNSIVFKQYRFSFVFVLDTISTLTLLLDFTNMPFVEDETYAQAKKSVAFRLMGLLSVLKLWRATRLFFRKNQTKTFLQINEQMMEDVRKTASVGVLMQKTVHLKKASTKMLQKSKIKQLGNSSSRGKKDFFRPDEDEIGMYKRDNPAKQALDKPLVDNSSPFFHPDISQGEMPNKYTPQISFHPADERKVQKDEFVSEEEIKLNTGGRALGNPKVDESSKQADKTDRSLKIKNNVSAVSKGLKDDGSFLDVFSKSEIDNTPRASKFALIKNTALNFGSEISSLMKERELYSIKKKQKDFILQNKMEASGNIRKTIAYRNVGTIACTVLMTSLGLSIFVSNLYYDTTPYCLYDAESVKDLLQVSDNRTPAMMQTTLAYFTSKYDNVRYSSIVEFSVGELIHFKDNHMIMLRNEEMYKCENSFSAEGKTYQIRIVLSNRFLMFYESLFNIMRTVFIVVILIYNIFMNNRDIKFIVMDPIEHIYEESSSLTVSPLLIEDIFQKNTAYFGSEVSLVETEWRIIAKLINYSANWLVNIFGKSAEGYLVKAINFDDYELRNVQGEHLEGIFCYIDTTQLVHFLATLVDNENYTGTYNACLSLLHREVTLMRGEIYSKFPGTYVFAWFFNDNELFDDLENNKDLLELRQKHITAKAELAFTSIASALFKLRIFLRNYTYNKHDRLQFRMDGLVSLAMHSGWAIKGPVGGSSKVDMVLTSRCITQIEELSKVGPTLGLDILFTESIYKILSNEVTEVNRRQKMPCSK